MTKKLSRTKILNLLNDRRHDGIYGAIKSGRDIPYYETSEDTNIWHNEYSSKDSLRISKKGLFELKTLFKIFPIPMPKGFQVKKCSRQISGTGLNISLLSGQQDVDTIQLTRCSRD